MVHIVAAISIVHIKVVNSANKLMPKEKRFKVTPVSLMLALLQVRVCTAHLLHYQVFIRQEHMDGFQIRLTMMRFVILMSPQIQHISSITIFRLHNLIKKF